MLNPFLNYAMPTLACIVVGDGCPFIVDIEGAELVAKLNDKIKEKNVNTITCDSKDLDLYLAFKEGAWLNLAGAKALTLDDLKGFDTMDPLSRIDNAMHFGTRFLPNEGEVHVLVTVAVANEKSSTTQLAAPAQEQMVETKQKRYVHSQMNSKNGVEFLQNMNMWVKYWSATPYPDEGRRTVDSFHWETVDVAGQTIALTESQQRARYREYMETGIGNVLAQEKLCVVGVENAPDLLTAYIPHLDIHLAGRTDLVILSDEVLRGNADDLRVLPGARMVVEVKKSIQSDSMFQALTELTALDLLTTDPVVALLTDLNDHWHFFWLSEVTGEGTEKLHVFVKWPITNPGQAFEIIRTLLTSSAAVIQFPGSEPLANRRKLRHMLPTLREGGDGVLDSIERYFDIESELGPDVEMARAVARQVVSSIPNFNTTTSMHS
ncbi:hypothetical protein DYB25_009613 [Aphanomyces astaci]|uniref:Crinkler effector protein N-terminal domain-containing protein n=1 Tax=Aphanomyces astaci TaxID=112090 RepID=A0A397AF12_APHAT|nr:hypothetical protein DYB25_009613 [Aphanomyces astaci]